VCCWYEFAVGVEREEAGVGNETSVKYMRDEEMDCILESEYESFFEISDQPFEIRLVAMSS
jgi:hypothetical protein